MFSSWAILLNFIYVYMLLPHILKKELKLAQQVFNVFSLAV